MVEMTRRAFIRDFGQGTLAVAILGIAVVACSDEDVSGGETTSTTVAPSSTTTTTAAPADSSTTVPGPVEAEPVTWERVFMGGVSAYVLVRRGEAALVDAGNPGSMAAIESGLTAAGVGWGDVGHVILTHLHRDHVGGLPDVLEAAPAAVGYAGAADIPSIDSPRELTPVGDGETVFGLQIIETPGHTPGHISVLDGAGGLLVAGDALIGDGTGVAGPSPQFSADMGDANRSVIKLAGLEYETVVFGHGSPVVGAASTQVAELASTL